MRAVHGVHGRLSRVDLEAVLGIVRLAYEGLEDQGAWAEMLRQVRHHFEALDAFLIRTPVKPGVAPLVMADGVDPLVETRWAKEFAVPSKNPPMAVVLDRGIDGTMITSDLVPWEQLEKTEFYDVIRRPRGVRWCLCGGRSIAEDSRRFAAVSRHIRDPRFSLRDETMMDHLSPHMDRVLKLHDEALQRERQWQAASAAVESNPDILVFLRPDGSVQPLNQRGAEFLSGNGRRPRVAGSLDGLPVPLRLALQEVIQFLAGIASPGGSLAPLPQERLVRLSDTVAIRMRCEMRFESGAASGVVVRCRPKAAAPAGSQVDLSRAGFTRREQEVARALLRGESSEEIRHVLGISRETPKTHVRNLCEKTGTRGRTQLVAHLFGGLEDPF